MNTNIFIASCGLPLWMDASLVSLFRYYVKLYKFYFDWVGNNKNMDFYEMCESEGMDFEACPTCYYS